jgi:hypothetical protein
LRQLLRALAFLLGAALLLSCEPFLAFRAPLRLQHLLTEPALPI